ncbi:MAG TPA: response regulator transcription factor [Anaerolineae bacterium]|nr:response regulator transcription factor [Anaerolineae bacterium]HNU03968.1 response regulator transcription factor [Anaerolineae bacterium]
MKTILLAESEKHVLDALHLAIEQRAEMKVVGEARSAESLLAQVCQKAPDVILLDWKLPGLHPQRLIGALREWSPAVKLIAFSVQPEHEKAAKDYGLDGFISKQLPGDSFIAALVQILFLSNNIQESQ